MSDWKQKIEAQIAYLTTMLGVQSQQRSKPSMMLAESIGSLKLLLDVAVAAEEITEMPTGEPDDAGNMKYVALVALDKLREGE